MLFNPSPSYLEHIPSPLAQMGPGGLAWWQWSGLAIGLIGAIAGAALLSWLARSVARLIVRRTEASWDDELIKRAHGPVALGFFIVIARVGMPWLELPVHVQAGLDTALRALVIIALFWGAVRLINVVAEVLVSAHRFESHHGLKSLIPLAARVANVLVFAVMLVALLAMLGYPVASFIAGLGIGGLAVALAAQKTLENFFGSLSIAGDRPFRVGDFVEVEGNQGTVEAIGLRSTRVRTLNRTVITLPNGKLADTKVENFGVRDRFRLHLKLGLAHGTTPDQIRQIVAGCDKLLREEPHVWSNTVVAHFVELAEAALRIELMAWFVLPDYEAFRVVQEKLLLGFMDIVAQAGASFASPTPPPKPAAPSGPPVREARA